ncbi:hypothetical protein [Clostridium sp. BJN0013]|uniref:hypothetical protein n=1 Tax=Clostridium sp. BJN0013 TaxID=3236840 RepID=UPI0034C5F767
MKKRGIIFFLLIYLISFQCYLEVPVNGCYNKRIFQKGYSTSLEKVDLFKDILDRTHSHPTECGGMLVFTTTNYGEKTANEIFTKLDEYYKLNKKVCKNNQMYSVDFNNSYIEGYIQSVKYEDYNIITINVIQKSNVYELKNIKNNLNECVPKEAKKCRYFQYVKAKVEYGKVEALNKQIKEILEYWDACNIKTVALQEGYTNTAYTHRYESIQSNGDLIDFNYAVMKYDMETYIIMGTPEIMTAY